MLDVALLHLRLNLLVSLSQHQSQRSLLLIPLII